MESSSEEQEIEGSWKNLWIRIATDEDEEILKAHLRATFYLDEPLSRCMGYTEDFGEDFDKMWTHFIPNKLSLIALDKETNKVAGVRITLEHRKDFDWSVFDLTSWQMKIILQYFDELDKEAKVFDRFDHLDRYADFFLMSVDPEYRCMGLASELYQRSIALIKANNFSLVKCVFSSPYTRKACEKLGFEEFARVSFLDGVNEKGEQYIPNAEPDQVVTLGVLQL